MHTRVRKYRNCEEYDSFIVHRRQKADLEKAQKIGVEAYNQEQKEKIEILRYLLANFNDGRKKNFFCVAVNLMELLELQEGLQEINEKEDLAFWIMKEKLVYVRKIFQNITGRRNISLKLNKKK